MLEANTALRHALDRAGYYPDLVLDVLDVAVADEEVLAHLVQPETTFDDTEVRRHLTALVLTATRFIMAHVDDGPGPDGRPGAAATTESVPLGDIRSVALTHGVSEPARVRARRRTTELTVAVTWGAVQRLDVEPASCDDPACEADHGYTGTISPEDVVVRVSAEAEGREALAHAVAFARALSAATARAAAAGRP